MGHQDDAFCALVDSILDCRQGTDDTLVVGNMLIRVEGDIKVDLMALIQLAKICTSSF